MKAISLSNRVGERGSALIATLLVTLLLGLTLASYLMLAHSQHASTARSQAWHQALVLAEAGVEEALAQLNPSALATNVTGGNGWALSDAGVFQPDSIERALVGGRYSVAYTPHSPPTIYSTGYTTLPSSGLLSRTIRVTTTNAALFAAGLSVEYINNPLRYPYHLSSYDSTAPTPSGDDYDDDDDDDDYDGGYGNGNSCLTNPPCVRRSEVPDVLPPFATGWLLPTKYNDTYSLSGNYFIPGNLNIPGNERLYVAPDRTAILYVVGDFTMSTNAGIEIAPTGTLQIYVGGRRAQLDYIDNQGPAQNFQYFGLPGNTEVTFTQITPRLVASIYAPQATFSAIGSSYQFDYSGALVVRNLSLTRAFTFVFDENLRRNGPRRGFVVNSWREL